jgi:hypothetical protein
VEIALALVLLFGAGLLIEATSSCAASTWSFRPAHPRHRAIGLPQGKYPGDAETARFFDRLLLEAKALPGPKRRA